MVLEQASEGPRPEAVPDPTRSRPGRGAWIHPRTACLQRALKTKAFARAFRGPVSTGRVEEAWADLADDGPGPQPQ